MENKEVRLIDANACPCNECRRQWCELPHLCTNFGLWLRRTIDTESLRPHGKWFECDYVEYDGHSECIHYPKAALGCTNCRNAFKKELLWKRNYCPNCGAVMQGVKDE